MELLQEERKLVDTDEEPAAKRKRIDSGLVQTLISAHNDAEIKLANKAPHSFPFRERLQQKASTNDPTSFEKAD